MSDATFTIDASGPEGAPPLSRAGISLLTLQLRAAQQEAAQAEVAATAADQALARIQQRNKIDPMLVERTHALDVALVQAREEAAQQVAAAHRDAAAMVATATASPSTPEPHEGAPADTDGHSFDESDGWYRALRGSTDPADASDDGWGLPDNGGEPDPERRALEAALAAARARAAEAKRRLDERGGHTPAVHAEVLELQRQLADVDARLAEEPAGIRAAAKEHAQQIITDARGKVSSKAGGTDVE